MNKGHGFLPDKLKPEDYQFGGFKVPLEALQDDGQWDAFLPKPELQQRNGLETYNCTSYGTLNCLEILLRRKFGREYDKSERYVGILAGTTPNGNSPQKIIETIRKESGLIDEELLPFDETIDDWDRYYSPDPMERKYIRKGKKWLEQYEVKHEWVLINDYTGKRQEVLKEALRFSPIGISVYAWKWRKDGMYIKNDELDNHFVTLYGYKDKEYWKIFDHYNDTLKKLVWNYAFGFAKRYYLTERELESWYIKIINFFKKLWPQ